MITGITVSKWQGEMRWKKAKDAGARFGYIRAGSCTETGGLLYMDDQFERNALLAPEYMPAGFFWYFRPYHDPVKQADYFCDLILLKNWKLPPACDLECSGSLTAFETTEATKAFCYRIFHRLSIWPLLYARAAWLNLHTAPDDFWSRLEFWVARYTNKPQPWGNLGDGPELTPRDFATWRFWQKSADGNGLGGQYGAESDSICIEYFNGGEAEFAEYIKGKTEQLVRVIRPAAAVRTGPQGTVIGTTWRGRIWTAKGKSADGAWTRVEGWIKTKDVESI